MSDQLNGPGLPAPILFALTPRRHYEEVIPPRPSTPAAPGAEFTRSQQDQSHRGDEQLFSELQMLAELHRAHNAARGGQGGGSSQSS